MLLKDFEAQFQRGNFHEPKKAVVRRLRRLTSIKTNPYPDAFAHLPGEVVSANNSMKICVNLRNLRIELGFSG
jgi:hypothetical protein